MQPATRYASVDGARIAYQVFGDGPTTIVPSAGSFSHTDVVWEDPAAALFYSRLASFARVVRYDRLGTSNSDPLPVGWDPSVAGYGRELDAVLAAAGVEHCALLAMLDAGPFAIAHTAAHPELVQKLILYNTTARFLRADDYEFGVSAETLAELLAHVDASWGSEAQVALNVPSRLGDERFSAWYGKFVRSIGTPNTIAELLRANLAMDARSSLASISVPTLVMHRCEYPVVPIAHGRYLAAHIPGATFVELPGADGPVFWEAPDEILERIRDFVSRASPSGSSTSQLSTILFTDIVRSTELAGALGDREWSALVGVHRGLAQRTVEEHGGWLVKLTGDGILATFPDPGLGIACAIDLRDQLHELGITIRAGLHTGRIEVAADDIGGLAVHIAARVMAAATDGDIFVSRTVRDLMLGAGQRFRERGRFALKGVDGEWELYGLD